MPMERFSVSSHVVDIDIMCGTSIVVEAIMSDIYEIIVPGDGLVSHSQLDEDKHIMLDVMPRNKRTISEKLRVALSMTGSIQLMHEDKKEGSL